MKTIEQIHLEMAPLLKMQCVRTRRASNSANPWYPLSADAWFIGACLGPDARDSAPCMARLRRHARKGQFPRILELCAELGEASIRDNPGHTMNDRTAENVRRCRELAAYHAA